MVGEMLSEHFSLREATRTEVRGVDNVPDESALVNMRWFFPTLIEPARFRFGPLRVISSFRNREVNTAVRGNVDSAHLYGVACDFEPVSSLVTLEEIIRWYASSGLPFDQVILEKPPWGWIHVGGLRPHHEPAPRKELLVTHDGKKYFDWKP